MVPGNAGATDTRQATRSSEAENARNLEQKIQEQPGIRALARRLE